MLKDAVDWHSEIAERFDSRYRDSASFRERLDVWTRVISTHANPQGDTLDAGCGSGVLSFVASQYSRTVLGFDASPEMVRLSLEKLAKAHAADIIQFRELRMEQLAELGDRRFSLIMSSSVLEYLEDFRGALADLARLLTPGGVLIFSVPNMSSVFRQFERLSHQLTGRPQYMSFVKSQPSRREVEAWISGAGLVLDSRLYYAPAPVISAVARPFGMRHLADNLVAYVCKQNSGGDQTDRLQNGRSE